MNISHDPFKKEGTERFNQKGFRENMGADGFPVETPFFSNATGAQKTWSKELLTVAYKQMILSMDALKAAINAKNSAAAKSAAARVKKDAEDISKLF